MKKAQKYFVYFSFSFHIREVVFGSDRCKRTAERRTHMRILFAAPDRDLLACYENLLSQAFEGVVTAFDGAQVLTRVREEQFDLVVLDRDLPRVENRILVSTLNDARVPVVVTQESALSLRDLQDEALPNAFLSYPFTSAELMDTMTDVMEKASGGGRFPVAELEADTAAFCLGAERVTAAELNILSDLAEGKTVPLGQNAACIGALNEKLAKQKSPARIRYRTGEGYRLVI